MAETKFTPGPWRVAKDPGRPRKFVLAEAGERIATVRAITMPAMRPSPTKPNAALIAAAPDLYAALEELAEAARNACEAQRHPPLTEALFAADAALSRARGEPE